MEVTPMDDKEKGLPLLVELYRQWRQETRDYFKYNGIYGGCLWIFLKLLITLLIIAVAIWVWWAVNGGLPIDINNVPYIPPM